MRVRLVLQVVLIVAVLAGSRAAEACECGRAVCFLHCPREAFTPENRAEGIRQLDEYLAKVGSLPPEARSSLPPEMQNVIAAAQRVKSANTENPLPPDELQRTANKPIATSGALDEAATIDFLTRNALRNSNGTTVRAGADQAWNDLISGRAATRTVSVGRGDDGAVVVQRAPPPPQKREPQPGQGIALPSSAPSTKSAPAPIPEEAVKRADESLEAARTKASQDGGVVIHRTKYSALGAAPPPPPPTGTEAEKPKSFYQQCTEEFMKRVHP